MALLSIEQMGQLRTLINGGVSQEQISVLDSIIGDIITNEELNALRQRLSRLIDVSVPVIQIPKQILSAFEPSQIGTIVGTVMDACIPELDKIVDDSKVIEEMGLQKHEGLIGEREGYPDYKTTDGYRLELKLLYIDPEDVEMKKPPTPREASARLTQKVTYKNVDVKKDVLLVIAYQFKASADGFYSPTIVDIGIFPIIHCLIARDVRLSLSPGRWFGNFETPAVLSKIGKQKKTDDLNIANYGRKESEGYDFNEDTNFGKLARIPYKPLQEFLKKHSSKYASKGFYPEKWSL